jgi:HSP20 family protein
MKLIPWRQRGELVDLRSELDALVNRFFSEMPESRLPAAFTREIIPPLNVAETEKSWCLSLEVPGLSEKDVQVQLMGRMLVISGERKWEEEQKGKEFRSVESQYGSFQRSFELPENALVDADALSAICKKGILEIVIPKTEPTHAAKVAVKAG